MGHQGRRRRAPIPAAGVAAGGRRATGTNAPPHQALDEQTLRLLHRTVAGASDDYAALRNNTAAAKLIEYTNHLTKQGVTRERRWNCWC